MLRINSHRIVVTISRRRVLRVGYLKITLVNPTYLDIGKTSPRLVLAQKAITLIQFVSRSSEACIVVAVTCGASSFTIETRSDELAIGRRLFAKNLHCVGT